MSNIRVRYGRDEKRNPKNTLVTVRIKDTLFFGISRCKLCSDRPVKHIGKDLASLRCEVAMEEPWNTTTKDGTLELHKSGVLGCVNVSEREKLLTYFRNIDDVLKIRK